MSYVVAGILLGLSCLITVLAVYLTRRYFSMETLEKYNEVGGVVFLQVGVIYGVLLSFVAVMVWDQYADASKAVEMEAAQIGTVFQLTRGFHSSPGRSVLKEEIVSYLKVVIDEEWPEMKKGRESATARTQFAVMWNKLLLYVPQSRHGEILYTEALQRLTEARESRRIRMFQITLAIPKFMWVLMISIGSIAVGLSCFFGVQSLRSQMVLSASLAVTITFVLSLVLMLDQPFAGDLVVSREPFEVMLKLIESAD